MNSNLSSKSIQFKVVKIVVLLLVAQLAMAQKATIERIDPPHWWAGMQSDTLYLLVKGKNLSEDIMVLGDRVHLIGSTLASNPDYVHVYLHIEKTAPAQTVNLRIGSRKVKYELRKRNSEFGQHQGLTPSDFIYLITPDRFANGNPKNDVIQGMHENKVDRSEPYARHGGDIQGIINNLDYLYKLGVTALWPSPLLENNQPSASYHGYAITDNYALDPRFGTEKEYSTLIANAHEKDMKIIKDMVYNHIGSKHYLVQSPPDSSWFNWWPDYTQTNYRATTLLDPYAANFDKLKMTDGWFDEHMADLNQRDPNVAKWLIQNSIWLIEHFDIDAFRIDTYAYPDQDFMSTLNRTILEQYPNFFIFAETWVHGHQVQSFFPAQNPRRDDETHLQSVTDFQLHYAINEALNQNHDWASGINRVYYSLAADWLYSRPDLLVTFLDNHDLARFYGVVNKDMDKFKVGVGLLLTLRGIPSLYYGTEVLLAETDGHGKIRQDFPGGWPNDPTNKFLVENRSAEENMAHGFIKQLANFRKTSPALTAGTLRHFVPENGMYVYFREHEEQTVMVIVNATERIASVKLDRFEEVLGNFSKTKSVTTGFEANMQSHINCAKMSITILELLP
ncbi:MAG: cyclomaltodextrinase C-terminal domain-containing protein [Schleiferiaceae bacterium]|nr:cyclomaltodextrinase C-terminal domain-containing protein [Schleiferiaceae bacterium]